jgi:hypothetical protein
MSNLSERFHEKFVPCPMTGCWLWTASLGLKGYGQIYDGGSKKNQRLLRAHRVAWRLYRGSVADDMYICHHCDVRSCVNPWHLFIGTPKENAEDMSLKNRSSRGERQGAHKLSRSDVETIRTSNLSQGELAQKYGVSKGCISHAITGRSWKIGR